MANNIMRMSGIVSGMDTESLVSALSSTYKTKVDKAKKAQTKLEWKQDSWKDMNSKIYGLYSGNLSSMRFTTAYNKKTVTTSNSALTVTAGPNSTNGVQSAKIKQMAKAGYLTGAKISTESGDKISQDTKLTELGIEEGTKITISSNGKTNEIEVTEGMTMFQFASALREVGVNANFDVNNQRLFVSSSDTGKSNDFTISSDNESALNKLGISVASGATKIEGCDAELEVNGALFESSSNSITINGATYQINAVVDDEISVTTKTDNSGIYDMVKDLLNQYNDVINSMSKAYNAEATSYEPLTDEEKEALSDKQIEDWEKIVKDSVLRKDESLNTIMRAMREAMSTGIEIDGKTYNLSNFGISTAGYFEADANERYAYHIAGNKGDATSAGKEDVLGSLIASNPELVTDFFTKLSQNLYGAIDKQMRSTDYSSIYKVYDDKKMKQDYDNYTSKISELEKKLADAEDRYYKQFANMEKMLSSINSKNDALSALFS